MSTEGGGPTVGSESEEAHRSLARVMAEIDEEVERRRSSGDMPPRLEHELDELFLRFSPMAGRDGSIEEALGVVESASFIDPVVPVASSRSGGAYVKRGIRKMSLWYVSWLTVQINRFALATARALRVLDDRVRALQTDMEHQRALPAPLIETDWAHGEGAWWVEDLARALGPPRGRVLHAAAGDGWLVRRLLTGGYDAYGVEPREGRIDRAEMEGLDLREEAVGAHLRAVGADALGCLVLSGVVDAMGGPERDALFRLATRAVAPGGLVVIHSLSERGWASERAPVETDLADGRPLRPRTWLAVFDRAGFDARALDGPDGLDYLVLATKIDPEGGGATSR